MIEVCYSLLIVAHSAEYYNGYEFIIEHQIPFSKKV